MFDAAFKLKVLDYAAQHFNKVAARIHGVDEKRVREWKKQREALEKLPAKKKRLDGAGRKAALPDIEDMLILWIDENLYVTCSATQRRAVELAQEQGNEEFLASRGWLQKSFKHHCLSIRWRTTVSQRLPADVVP